MVNIIKQEIEIEESLKKKFEFICGFCNTTPTIINGNIIRESPICNLLSE